NNSLLSMPFNTSLFSPLDNSFIAPEGVLTSLFAEQADKNRSSTKPAQTLLLIHIRSFFYFLMKFLIIFRIRKLHSLFPKVHRLLLITKLKKDITLMFNQD